MDKESILINTCEIFGLVLGENSLADVDKVIGQSRQIHIGEAATSEYIKCYHLVQGNNSAYLIFGSHGEMAGHPDYKLTSTIISSKPFNFIKQSDITELLSVNKELATG